MADSTTTNPSGTPVSSPTTSVAAASAGALPGGVPTGTGTSTGNGGATGSLSASGGGSTREQTLPQIWIATSLPSASAKAAVTIQFDYMPENVSFGVTCMFTPYNLPQTSGRFMIYDHSEIDEVSLTVKVVAGCNNCLTFFSVNTSATSFQAPSPLVAGRYERNSLIDLAKALYSLPLPSDNTGIEGNGQPPQTCRLKVGKMFSGIGGFTRCSVQFNGPYDSDGSPTDMDVSLGFLPSEFYDSSRFAGASEGIGQTPKSTPTAELELTGGYPYALYFGETQATGTGKAAASDGGDQTNPQTPTTTYPTITNDSTVPQSQVQGPTSPTPTNAEAGAAEGYPANQVYYVQKTDTYLFGPQDPVTHVPLEGATPISGQVVRAQVESNRAGVRP